MAQADGAPVCQRILVVEDDVDSAEMFQELLEELGYEVRVALDGANALLQAQAFHPDVVFLDIGLPVMDGYETCKKLLSIQPRVPRIVAVSGRPPSEEPRFRQAGFDAVLAKPIAWERVLEIVPRRSTPACSAKAS